MTTLPNITASIPLEVQTIALYIERKLPTFFAEVRGQSIPKRYTAGHCIVQWEGDDVQRETGVVDRYDRVFNILPFASKELESLQQIDELQRIFTNVHSLQIEGSSRYMRIGSFLPSRPFLTEDGVVYASIGKLHVQVRRMAEQEVVALIGGIVIRSRDGEEIVIGKDCRKGEM